MLSFMLNLQVKPGNEQRAVDVLSEIDRQANTHDGCISFAWYQHIKVPQKFSMIESWENKDYLDKHVALIIDIWNELVPFLDGDAVSTELRKLV